MIIMDSVVIPRPPALPPMPLVQPPKPPQSLPSSNSNGFRLMEDQGDTGSVYSIYKQKIDAMFNESDSSSSQHTKNSVQARIEKMFTDVARDNNIPVSLDGASGCHSFSVDYLGSVALTEKVTSLSGLQTPLRDLYFAYKKTTKLKKQLTGRLEISSQGLKVQYQGEKGDLEQMNSFPTIAVWSAVKFVIQQRKYAFLPLITDPDNIDKRTLFRGLSEAEAGYISAQAHQPLFAVVMRKIGVQKQLECHGFVCQTSEDAIVIAATLYKSLMAHMRAKEKKPKSRNGIHCMSIASSVFNDGKSSNLTPVRPPRKKRSTCSSTISENDPIDISDTQPLLSGGKSPKKSVKTRRAPKAPDDFDAILPYEEPVMPPAPSLPTSNEQNSEIIKPKTFSDKINTFMSREQKQITAEIKQVMSESSNRGLKHVQSMRKIEEETLRKKVDNSGDILTKVTIPRSGSFLNAGGLTRYKSKVSRSNGQATGGSPLGFNELFNEFRLQEGLHSMDEILGVIIDPEGMSFNDLKPIYKEFLLKLSVTLTKDELYQRSKSIMRRHKKKLLRRTSSALPGAAPRRLLIGGKFKRLKHIFQKSFKKPKTAKAPVQAPPAPPLPESSISTSSYDTRQFTPKPEPVGKGKKKRRDRASTSEESDFFSVNRRKQPSNGTQNRNSSSGYVSCSECSYDSDTCTCVSADKCYCSLGNKKHAQPHSATTLHSKLSNMTFCECDTDSCAESNKCYCQSGEKTHLVHHQLRKRGLLHANPNADKPIPPLTNLIHSKNHRKLCKKSSNTKSTRSVEYMPNPAESYYEKLQSKTSFAQNKRRKSDGMATLDYELFSIQNQAAAYAAVMSEGMHKHASMRSFTSSKYKNGRGVQSAAIRGACTEALSVKKSAEIAALFADIKLSQTTDIAQLAHLDSIISSRNAYNRMKTQQYHTGFNQQSSIKSLSGQKMIHNGLYGRMSAGNGSIPNKSSLYSATNGLYTIQSQSDESRRSSLSEGKRAEREYFELEPQRGARALKSSSNLENSLGYLP